MGVDNGVVGVDGGVDELLHDVGHVLGIVLHEMDQVLITLDLVGAGGAHAVVGLGHGGIAHRLQKGAAALQVIHQVVAGGGDAGLGVELLHSGLVADPGHILILEAAGDVEVRPQAGVHGQPVLVVGLQPVDAAVLEGEEGHRPVDLVIIFQTAHLVILIETVLQVGTQLVIGLVADAQHIHAVVFQFAAELPVVGGKVGGDKMMFFICPSLFPVKWWVILCHSNP